MCRARDLLRQAVAGDQLEKLDRGWIRRALQTNTDIAGEHKSIGKGCQTVKEVGKLGEERTGHS